MTLKKVLYLSVLLAGIFAVGFTFAMVRVADANPSEFCFDSLSSTFASTTLAYIKPGVGTTTLAFTNCGTSVVAASQALVQMQFTASTTAPIIRARIEHSRDNIDWYPDNDSLYQTATAVGNASTTIQTTPYHDFSYTFSTSTPGFADYGGSGSGTRMYASLQVTTPTRFTRVIFYMPSGGGEGSLYAEAIGQKERP